MTIAIVSTLLDIFFWCFQFYFILHQENHMRCARIRQIRKIEHFRSYFVTVDFSLDLIYSYDQ